MSIEQNLIEVRRRMDQGQQPGPTLVAVSKTIDPIQISEAFRCGQMDFAENRVQEWLAKKDQLPVQCRWHFIGRMQKNKIKYLDESIVLIHSLDRLSLLEALNTEGEKRNHRWRTLLQVNVAGDDAKAGVSSQEVPWFLDKSQKYPFVSLCGLMTIGRLNASVDETRTVFAALRELRDSMVALGVAAKEQFTELSMGMSDDYEIALAEGATIVRIGSGIFR
ncbi:MAG: YggS family pyridoxal phosphate-dependent enzyme [Peptococcaceae bacterium]|nr:YggS family pyridoxal phosphate-dependent enzyme [Peptococcaceae bacterium]